MELAEEFAMSAAKVKAAFDKVFGPLLSRRDVGGDRGVLVQDRIIAVTVPSESAPLTRRRQSREQRDDGVR